MTNNTVFKDHLRTLFPAVADTVILYITDTIYPPPGTPQVPYKTDIDRATLFTSELSIACNAYFLGLAYRNEMYNYLFDVPPAIHGDDLHYTLGPDPSTQDQSIRRLLQDYLTTFAETGNPNRAGRPTFDTYGSGTRVLDLFPEHVKMIPDPAAVSDRCLQLREYVYT